jgi:hypothetical protein
MPEISVSLPDDVLAFVRRTADRECRSVGAQMRYFAAEAMRRAGQNPAATALEEWPPPLPEVTGENLPEIQNLLAEWQGELDRLEAADRGRHPNGLPRRLTIDQQNRRGWLRTAIGMVSAHVAARKGLAR